MEMHHSIESEQHGQLLFSQLVNSQQIIACDIGV
jgi:hypothetical protein